MSILGDRIKEAREAMSPPLSQSDLARRVGATPQAIQAIESGRTNRTRLLRPIAVVLGRSPEWLEGNETLALTDRLTTITAPVRGIVAAGLWQEDSRQVGDDTPVPRAPEERYAHLPQIAFRVMGNSMNKLVQDGQYVICIDYQEFPIPLRNGDKLVVERRRVGTLERSLKEYRTNGRKSQLWPVSDDPEHQEPLNIESPEADTEVVVVGFVVGYYKPA